MSTNKSLATIASENEITAPVDQDFMLYAIDAPGGTPVDAGVRPANFFKLIQYLATVATVDVANDLVMVFDNSAGAATVKSIGGLGMLPADGSVELTANWDAGAFEIRAQTFESDVATGTAPLTIASATLVANLNADKLDGADVNDSGTSTSDLWTANKIQASIDAAVDGRSWKDDVRVRATANVDLAGGGLAAGQTVDGVTLATGDRVACFEQSTGTEDGVYVVPATGAASRSDDFASGDACAGFAFRITEGTTHADTTWYVSNDKGSDTVGTHAVTLAGGGTGETNTASSIGGGDANVYKTKTGVDLEFRTISGTNGVAVSENGDVVEISGAAFATAAGNLSQFAATTSAQLASTISDETGSGALVFASSPTLVTPALGTPSSGVLTNCTGLPVAGIADGTDGELITWDASGNASTVSVGTSGHVLTSNGAGAAPTFQAASGGGGGMSDVVDDTTPQLGGDLDVNGQKIVSVSNGNIDIEPNGTGNVLLGNFTFDADQSVSASQDDYVLTYDHSTGLISLEAATGGGGGMNDLIDDTTPQLGGMLDINGQSIGDGTLELLTFTETASAVNHVNITNATTGNAAVIGTAGDDTNIDLSLSPKGTGYVQTENRLKVLNDFEVSGSVSSTDPVASDRDLSLNTKGDGFIVMNAGAYTPVTALSDGSTTTLDCADGNAFTWTLPSSDDDRTLAFSNLQAGQEFWLYVDGSNWNSMLTGTLTWPGSVKWDGDSADDPTQDRALYKFYAISGSLVVATRVAGGWT